MIEILAKIIAELNSNPSMLFLAMTGLLIWQISKYKEKFCVFGQSLEKVDDSLRQLDSKFENRFKQLDNKFENKFEKFENKFEHLENKFEKLGIKVGEFSAKVDLLYNKG